MNSFDIDGVITVGIYPGPCDVIITGRSFEEAPETIAMLRSKGIQNEVYFNPRPFSEKSRLSSGEHKKATLERLALKLGDRIIHFEDDDIQADVIKTIPDSMVYVVRVVHELTEKENVRHEWNE